MAQKQSNKVSQKAVAWIIGGVIIILALVAIAIGVASNNHGSAERADKDNLSVENGDGEKIETKYSHVDGSKFFLKIPTEFHTLTAAEINKKYSGEVPDTVFSNEDNDVNIAISINDAEVKNEQIEEYLNIMIELLENSGDIIKSDYYEVNKHNIATIKVATSGSDGDFYNHMMFFSENDKLVVIAFNCKLSERKVWENVGDFVLDSLYFEK